MIRSQLNVKQQELTEWQRRQHGVINNCKEVYNWAIKNGIAKEQARAVLPKDLHQVDYMQMEL